jgi:tRNA threonylcarbamoyladenosine biosynthesis protein TsaB
MKKLLAIDTSTECASVALLVDGDVTSAEQAAQRMHAQVLLPTIDRLMGEAGIGFSQLNGIVFGRGPGSFTGLRIACSVVKGLAYAHDLPLFPASTLASIANEAWHKHPELKDHAVLAMLDARMHQVYWSCFGTEPWIEKVSAASDIEVSGNDPLILAGVGYESYREHLPSALASRIRCDEVIHPTAKAMLRLAQGGELQAVSAGDALPVYLRNKIV